MVALSPEFVYNVLLHLPVKPLLRFRCLSKSSCAEIDSADFVKNHLKRSVQCNANQKLIIINDTGADWQICFADFDDGLQHTIPLNSPFRSQGSFTFVCGSCNGLILLAIGSYQNIINLAIWNPFTRQYKIIPLPPDLTQNFIGYGLGYDSAHDDYKIVIISKFNNICYSFYPQVRVFSLKSNSWRCGRDVADAPSCLQGYYANGALYWEKRVSLKRKFIGFDLTNEVFFNVPKLPDFCPETVCYYFLMVLGGNLYTQTMHAATPGKLEFYLLVSGKGGEVASGNWRKEFEVEAEHFIIRDDTIRPFPLVYSKGGDSILLKVTDGDLCWYNLEKKTRQKVEIAGNSWPWSFFHHVCWESLVSLGNDTEFDGATDEESDDDI